MICPHCRGVGRLLDEDKIIRELPRTDIRQPGITCPWCNGLKYIQKQPGEPC
jgi:hypothetical protein